MSKVLYESADLYSLPPNIYIDCFFFLRPLGYIDYVVLLLPKKALYWLRLAILIFGVGVGHKCTVDMANDGRD